MPQPYKLFIIYAREDAQYLEELRGQLRPLEHGGRIRIWNDREINPGVDWEKEIVQNLDTADLILILVSAAYYNSAYIHEKEIKYALDRHERGEAKVLPVIVRPCSFLDDPVISRLQVLPTDGKAVTSHHWRERDDAWVDVVAGVKRALDLLRDAENRREQEQRDAAERTRQAAEKKKADARRAREAEAETQARREREAEAGRLREAQLKQKSGEAVPLKRYAAIGGGALALLLAFWLIPRMFGGKSESDGGTPSHPVTTTEEAPDTSSRQSATAAKAPSISAPPQNITVEKPKEEKNGKASAIQSPPAIRSRKSGFELVSVKGGAFQMGSPESEAGRYNDECQHTVTVASFSIGKYEVTQADWREIMGSDPPELSFKGCDQCPVDNVSWDDIQGFLLKLNARYPGKNYRLPTEAEWEYAARGGREGADAYFIYAGSGSNDVDEVAWYSGNSGLKTHPVGTKKANRLGLFDMSGNVWEWCRDTYKPYPCDNKNQAEGSYRVLRGGGWYYVPQYCRSASRDRLTPSRRSHDLGFRLASSSF